MGRKRSASKSKATFVDEEASLSMIENQEFMAMRAAQKIWSAPTTTEDQLCKLVSDGLIEGKEFADWKALGQHRVSTPGPGEIVLFVSFIRAGLCLPASAFLHRFLGYFGVSLNHLAPNVVLHLSIFVHLCETFLRISSFSFSLSSLLSSEASTPPQRHQCSWRLRDSVSPGS